MHILITGASSGIGASLARQFGTDPTHRITLVARRENKLRELAAELAAETNVLPWDLSNPQSVPELVSQAVEAFGPVDCLINNAGMNRLEAAHAMGHQHAATLFNLNVLSPMALVEAVYPSMREQGKGSIVNVSSVAAINTPTGLAHYSATKAALARYSEALHLEAKADGIHVLTVYPGPVTTAMEASIRKGYSSDLGMAGGLPMGTPEELATKVAKAIRTKTRKVYYPEFYRSAFAFPALSQCLTEKFSPQLESELPAAH